MKKAPILIPTCNRYTKLNNLIDSISRCELANETELFISVDYPPKEDYMNGWEKVKSYLKELKYNNCFKRVRIFEQKENIGPEFNIHYLENEAEKEYEYAIITEDDNIFSCNALFYFNCYLEKYINDSNIQYISGYNPVNIKCGQAAYIDLNAEFWGYGVWFKKNKEMRKWLNWENVSNYANEYKNIKKLKHEYGEVFSFFLNGTLIKKCKPFVRKDGCIAECDVNNIVYLLANNKYSVFPSYNLIFNDGFDGGGQNCDICNGKVNEISGQHLCFNKDVPLNIINNHCLSKTIKQRYTELKLLIKWYYWKYNNNK